MDWQIIIDGKVYDGIIGDRNYDSNNIILDNEPVADSLNKIANYLNTEDFIEKRYYPAWQDFAVVGTEYYLTLDQNATSNFTIDNLNRIATDILDFSVINSINRNLMYKSGSLLNINSNVVRVLSFDSITGKITLNFTPKSTFRINYLCQYANNEVPIGKKLEVENTEITVQNSDDASEIAYDNSTSLLSATDVKSAIDELELEKVPNTMKTSTGEVSKIPVMDINGNLLTTSQLWISMKRYSDLYLGRDSSVGKALILLFPVASASPCKIDGRFTINRVSTQNNNFYATIDLQSFNGLNSLVKFETNLTSLYLGTITYNSVSYYCIYSTGNVNFSYTFSGLFYTSDTSVTLPTISSTTALGIPTNVYFDSFIEDGLYKRIAIEGNSIVVNGGWCEKFTTVTASTTLTANHNILLCNATSSMTLTLPTAVNHANRIYKIKNINHGVVTIAGFGGTELIDGLTTTKLNYQYDSITLMCNGSSWYII